MDDDDALSVGRLADVFDLRQSNGVDQSTVHREV